jgi:hypothetical protein
MASPQDIQVTLGNRISDRDATLGSALERVLEAQQDLVIRRANLLIEELAAQTSSFVAATVIAALGAAIAFVGWFLAVAGIVDALDDHFARFAVEIAIGAIHVAAGLAIVLTRGRRPRGTA